MKDLGFSNLGFINIALLYLFFAIMSMFAIPLNRYLGSRLTLCLSGFTYAIWIAGFLLPAYKFEYILKHSLEAADEIAIFNDGLIITINLGTAVLLGLGAGPLWVSQAAFISECANYDNKGTYNSIFWSLFQVGSIVTDILDQSNMSVNKMCLLLSIS